MSEAYWYFKLFNSIKEKHEVVFAELELTSLFGPVDRKRNFSDILDATPFGKFRNEPVRVQDFLAHELPYGKCHGFLGKTNEICSVTHLVRRLAYTREFFAVTRSNDPDSVLGLMFPTGERGKNVECFQNNDYVLLRFITNQYFLEKSQYISKLSRNEAEAYSNVGDLFSFLTRNLYRIPATETMQIGKRLEDYFAKREEPSLYLTHYMHPYKGKFHPKMVRALLNYIFPKDSGMVMDNFAGCGTLLVEAAWMGLNSIGVDINPLSALMSNVKCDSLGIPVEELRKAIDDYSRRLSSNLLSYEKQTSGSALLFAPEYSKDIIDKARGGVPAKVLSLFKDQKAVDRILVARELTRRVENKKTRDFLLLALSGTISDLTRRRRGEFFEILQDRLRNLYLRIYIFSKLNDVLKINLGKSITYAADTRDMKMIPTESIEAIVNSPPYSTALDYIKNDYPQLALLDLADISQLEVNMIGNPKPRIYPASLFKEMNDDNQEYARLPTSAKEVVSALAQRGRQKEALRTYKFFKDMYHSLSEMHRVLKKGAKSVVIIGNNQYKLDGDYEQVRNDEILKEMAQSIGFKEDRTIRRELEKTKSGMIRYESILILEKPLNS